MINLYPLILVLIGSFIGAVGSIFIKKGVDKYSFFNLLKSPQLLAGLCLYLSSTIFYVIALKQGELSVLYPLVSTAYIWTTLFSVRFLGEKMNSWKWIALSGIVLGVVFIGLGS